MPGSRSSHSSHSSHDGARSTATAPGTASGKDPTAAADLPIADYGLIGDCHSAALVSRAGSIDWCCLPRFDSDSCFGRLLDAENGGHCSIAPTEAFSASRGYLGDSLVLQTTYSGDHGTVQLTDFFAMRSGGRDQPRREILRIAECRTGQMRLRIEINPRFDFGEVKPWLYQADPITMVAVGSNTALVISGSIALEMTTDDSLAAEIELKAGDRLYLAMRFRRPEQLDAPAQSDQPRATEVIDARLQETLAWWQQWSTRLAHRSRPGPGLARSAITLKALTYAPSGAMVAAPTTSLPEVIGGERNWDYRFSWIRDSVYMVRALASLGLVTEADRFRRFIQLSAAGRADELQVLYGVDGKRRLTEIVLPRLSGWRGSKPVRIGNAATTQYQADMYGLLLELAWQWSDRGHQPDEPDWRFVTGIVNAAKTHWARPDRGIWEVRGKPRHFVHSKAMCWVALDRGIRLAERHRLPAPLAQWQKARAAIAQRIEAEGVDPVRGNFVAAFGGRDVDAALLLLPAVGFVGWDDPRMRATVDAIQRDLTEDGLILRYRSADGLTGNEGAFLACSFWLVECLSHQGRQTEARALFDRVCACANDLGLFPEEYSVREGEMLGNFPQGLTHLAHVSAALALGEMA